MKFHFGGLYNLILLGFLIVILLVFKRIITKFNYIDIFYIIILTIMLSYFIFNKFKYYIYIDNSTFYINALYKKIIIKNDNIEEIIIDKAQKNITIIYNKNKKFNIIKSILDNVSRKNIIPYITNNLEINKKVKFNE